MTTVIRVLTWTAIVALPGGMILLPVVLADRFARRRTLPAPAPEPKPEASLTPRPALEG